jgi:hypothetical protein
MQLACSDVVASASGTVSAAFVPAPSPSGAICISYSDFYLKAMEPHIFSRDRG